MFPVFIFLVVSYFILVFVSIRLFVPYYGFCSPQIPSKIPPDIEIVIRKLHRESRSDREFIKGAYIYLTHRYSGSRTKIFTHWQYAFDPIFVHQSGFLPCNILNQILRIMLVKSGRFSNDDITTCIVFLNFFIHQYLQVSIDSTHIDLDPSYYRFGIPFGKHAQWFA